MLQTKLLRNQTKKQVLFAILIAVVSFLSIFPGHQTLAASDTEHDPALVFDMSFLPSSIAPGSYSVLKYSITNTSPAPVSGISFTNTLPAGLSFEALVDPVIDCQIGEMIVSTSDGNLIVSNGSIGLSDRCTISVYVSGNSPGTYMNTTSDLISSAGTIPGITKTLTVTAALPGFSAKFEPDNIKPGEKSTLVFTIDNSMHSTITFNTTFNNYLPEGLVVASPNNLQNDCIGSVSAVSGDDLISFFGSILYENTICEIRLDVEVQKPLPEYVNITGDLSSSKGNSGKSITRLTREMLLFEVTKKFMNSPTVPGGIVHLQYSLINRYRDAISGIEFSDPLFEDIPVQSISNLASSSLCGSGSIEVVDDSLVVSDGILSAGQSCNIDIELAISESAAPGSYISTSSRILYKHKNENLTQEPVSTELIVEYFPVLSMNIVNETAGSGGEIVVEYTITNPDPLNGMTGISFQNNLDLFIPGLRGAELPKFDICGSGSVLQQQIVPSPNNTVALSMSNGYLPAASSCSFQTNLSIPTGITAGFYENNTGPIYASINSSPVTGPPATSDEILILAGPSLTKSFSSSVIPGNSVEVTYLISNEGEATVDLENISFSDDFAAIGTGLVLMNDPGENNCNPGLIMTMEDTLDFSGGVLPAGESCRFSVELFVPQETAPLFYTSRTSDVSAQTLEGIDLTSSSASDILEVAGIRLQQRFLNQPYVYGDPLMLEIQIDNLHPLYDFKDIYINEYLYDLFPGTTLTPFSGFPCGASSSLIGTNYLTLTGGSLSAGASCSFIVTLANSTMPDPGDYSIIPRNAHATAMLPGGDQIVTVSFEQSFLQVASPLLAELNFVLDDAGPGESVLLEVLFTNNSTDNAITELSFSSDVENILAGMQVVNTPQQDICGTGSVVSGSDLVTLVDGLLSPNETCSFQLELLFPDLLPPVNSVQFHPLDLTGNINESIFGLKSTDDSIVLNPFRFESQFAGVVNAGNQAIWTLTLENLSSADASNALSFTIDLDEYLPGARGVNLPIEDLCGSGSQLSGESEIIFRGGSLHSGQTCRLDLLIDIPVNTYPDIYTFSTGALYLNEEPFSDSSIARLEVWSSFFLPIIMND